MPDDLSNLKGRIGRWNRTNIGLPMTHSREDLAEAFRRQAGYCEALGSPLWAQLMRWAADDILAGGPIGQTVAGWSGDLHLGALALRFFGGLHYLALSDSTSALAAHLPSTGGQPGVDLWQAVSAAVADNADLLKRALESPPQTNEVGRSAVLLGGFLRTAARTRLPLRLREIGSSAGLNQCWDRFAYELGPHRWAGRDRKLTIAADWLGGAPDLDAPVSVADRRGCDLRPIDLADPDARLWLQAYVWPDQATRLAMLRAAMATALTIGIHVEKASASTWLARELADRPSGQTTVIYHSVVMQYFDDAERAAFTAALDKAGAAATSKTPIAWLRLEHDALMDDFALRLTLWPGPEETLLALAHPHGRSVQWRG
jgi:hypothetical protein